MRSAGSLVFFVAVAAFVGCGSSRAGSAGAPDGSPGAVVDSGRTSARDAARDTLFDASREDGPSEAASHDGSLAQENDGSESLDAGDRDGWHADRDAESARASDSARADTGALDAHSRDAAVHDAEVHDAEAHDATGPACEITYPMGAAPSSSPVAFQAWSMDPYHGCQICDPTVTLSAWTPAPDGTPCGFSGGTCQAGACSTGAALGSSCDYGVDCASGYCEDNDVTGVSSCAFSAGQPGDGCEIGTCANGTYCIPFTNCDPSQGSRCEIFYRNVCL